MVTACAAVFVDTVIDVAESKSGGGALATRVKSNTTIDLVHSGA
jgi:hypothetical protein